MTVLEYIRVWRQLQRRTNSRLATIRCNADSRWINHLIIFCIFKVIRYSLLPHALLYLPSHSSLNSCIPWIGQSFFRAKFFEQKPIIKNLKKNIVVFLRWKNGILSNKMKCFFTNYWVGWVGRRDFELNTSFYNLNSFSSLIALYSVRLDKQFFRALSKYFRPKMDPPVRKIGPYTPM